MNYKIMKLVPFYYKVYINLHYKELLLNEKLVQIWATFMGLNVIIYKL